jgi:hypothetical protein
MIRCEEQEGGEWRGFGGKLVVAVDRERWLTAAALKPAWSVSRSLS